MHANVSREASVYDASLSSHRLDPRMTARLREIPYNYTSFSDREIVIRILGEETWESVERAAQRSVVPAARRACCTKCWATSGRSHAIPICRTICSTIRADAIALVEAMRHRLREIEARRQNAHEQVTRLLDAASAAVDAFEREFEQTVHLRKRALRRFTRVTRRDNICFDGFARVSHVTDATDWRVEYPFVVLNPDTEEEVAECVRACVDLGLTVIPRGGGTGYTGGAIPLTKLSAVINTEKLDWLDAIEADRVARM